uniref:Uncharacterized protein n=1 Tax=Anopheles christyi TaxID=43041 RepID=A0A182KI70_9DIPT
MLFYMRIAIVRSGWSSICTHWILTRFSANVLSIEADLSQQRNRSVRCIPREEFNDNYLSCPHSVRFVHDVKMHVIVRVVLSYECAKGKHWRRKDNVHKDAVQRYIAFQAYRPEPGIIGVVPLIVRKNCRAWRRF